MFYVYDHVHVHATVGPKVAFACEKIPSRVIRGGVVLVRVSVESKTLGDILVLVGFGCR